MARSDSSKDKSDSDSSRKVAKAARAGQTPSASAGRERRPLGFPMAIAAIFIVGTSLVVFSWNARDVQALSPSFNDHWHVSFGVYDCRTDSFQEPLLDPQIPNAGIHTHNDGVVHVEPRTSGATGKNAQLKVLAESTRVEITDTRITFPDREELNSEGVECGGEPAILQVARFAPGQSTPSETLVNNIADYRFLENQEAFVIALAPEGAVIPPPPRDRINTAAASAGLLPIDSDSFPADDDGNLLDDNGELILDAEGNPINVEGFGGTPTPPEDEGEGDDAPQEGDGDLDG